MDTLMTLADLKRLDAFNEAMRLECDNLIGFNTGDNDYTTKRMIFLVASGRAKKWLDKNSVDSK